MSLSVFLIVIGIILALLVNWLIGIVCIVLGVALLLTGGGIRAP